MGCRRPWRARTAPATGPAGRRSAQQLLGGFGERVVREGERATQVKVLDAELVEQHLLVLEPPGQLGDAPVGRAASRAPAIRTASGSLSQSLAIRAAAGSAAILPSPAMLYSRRRDTDVLAGQPLLVTVVPFYAMTRVFGTGGQSLTVLFDEVQIRQSR